MSQEPHATDNPGAPSEEDPSAGPWHQPGRWLVNPAYWSDEAQSERAGMPSRIRFIDCTLSEGDDCVGHQPNWNTRLGMIERLDTIGVGEITMPSHVTFSEERDIIKACRRLGIRTPLVAKGPGISPPLEGDWRGVIDRHVDLGTEVLSPIVKWSYADTVSDFSGALGKSAVVDAIGESIAYMKQQGVRVVPWMVDSMRSPIDTACLFFKAMADAGADGVYVVDSRGNSTPLATRVFIRSVRKAVGACDIYVQHHNDLGVATANAMAAVEGGANWIDASVIGIGDRGGCVALEEAAVLFEMYGIETGIALDKLYDLCCYVQQAYGIVLPPWKPIAGRNWNKEEGLGHLEGSTAAEATVGVSPRVVGRDFEAVIGSKILFGRERSSAHSDEPLFLRDLLDRWGMAVTEEQLQTILFRARAAVATTHDRHYLTFDEFRAIAEGVVLGGRG
jgi:isopropylmalate/homocitrate/citramalate synthase